MVIGQQLTIPVGAHRWTPSPRTGVQEVVSRRHRVVERAAELLSGFGPGPDSTRELFKPTRTRKLNTGRSFNGLPGGLAQQNAPFIWLPLSFLE